MVAHQHTQRIAALDVMTDSPVCAVPSDTVDRVAQLMRSEDVGPIPVVDNHQNRRLLGIITNRDLALKVVAEGRDPGSTTVESVITRNPVTVHPRADLQRVLKLMADHQVRRIPVVDDQGRLLGIIAQSDVATRVEAPQQTATVVEQISQPSGMMHGWNMPMMSPYPRARPRDGDDTTKLIGPNARLSHPVAIGDREEVAHQLQFAEALETAIG
jgi:CBS domain-containing protein